MRKFVAATTLVYAINFAHAEDANIGLGDDTIFASQDQTSPSNLKPVSVQQPPAVQVAGVQTSEPKKQPVDNIKQSLVEAVKQNNEATKLRPVSDDKKSNLAQTEPTQAPTIPPLLARIAPPPYMSSFTPQSEPQPDIGNAIKRFFQAKIITNWALPPNSSGLNMTVRVLLSEDGRVNDIIIVHSSGSPTFDQSVITAIQASAPFTLPDDPIHRKQLMTFTSKFVAR